MHDVDDLQNAKSGRAYPASATDHAMTSARAGTATKHLRPYLYKVPPVQAMQTSPTKHTLNDRNRHPIFHQVELTIDLAEKQHTDPASNQNTRPLQTLAPLLLIIIYHVTFRDHAIKTNPCL